MKKIIKYSTPLIAGCILISGCAKSIPIRKDVYNKLEELDTPHTEKIDNLEITVSKDFDYYGGCEAYMNLHVKIKNQDTGNVLEMLDKGALKSTNFFLMDYEYIFDDVDL